MVRTETGAELFEMLRPALEFAELEQRGNRQAGVSRYIQMQASNPGRPPAPVRKLIALLQRWRGAKGLEFARTVIEMKMLRNMQHVRDHAPQLEQRIVPAYVYDALQPYSAAYEAAFGRSLSLDGPADQGSGEAWL
jgi:coenzyme F420 hydrogenase subunit beta